MSDKKSKKADAPHSPGRRDAIKTLLTLPLAGALGYGIWEKAARESEIRDRKNIFHFNNTPVSPPRMQGGQLRIGIIGFGIRGKQLMRALGFAEPTWIDEMVQASRKNGNDTRYEQFMQQDDLDVVINGVCDVFDVYGERAVAAGSNAHRQGTGGRFGPAPKRYLDYRELLAADDIDAVIIATPDHWHAQMTIDAVGAGKHVYLEKPMSWTVEETYRVREAVKKSGLTFQLGHQGRQTDGYIRAKEMIDRNMLGKVNLIEVCTNRNTPNGAWVYPIIDGASPGSIDWKQFEGPAQSIREYEQYMRDNRLERYMGPDARDKFSLERFFRWRCWWDYSTGLSGDLLTHEYDAVNQIMGLGIPTSVTSSGGTYVYKDGRTVPDVLQTCMEFKDHDLTMLYSATQGNSRPRGKVIMGSDASLEVSNTLSLTVDANSEQYKDKIADGTIDTKEPFYIYVPGSNKADGYTSATELYFAQRGLLYTYLGGRRYDTTHLHLRDWLYCIRAKQTPSCDIDAAFEDAMAAHMGTRAFLEGRRMYWDKDNERIVRGEMG